MTTTNWPANVNSDFFAYTKTPKDDTVETEFMGGRKVVFSRNTRRLHEISASISLDLPSGEHERFWNWFDAMGGKAGIFQCPSLGSSYYRFMDIPSEDGTSMKSRTLTLSIEEVY